jgi:hypothetical protein
MEKKNKSCDVPRSSFQCASHSTVDMLCYFLFFYVDLHEQKRIYKKQVFLVVLQNNTELNVAGHTIDTELNRYLI